MGTILDNKEQKQIETPTIVNDKKVCPNSLSVIKIVFRAILKLSERF